MNKYRRTTNHSIRVPVGHCQNQSQRRIKLNLIIVYKVIQSYDVLMIREDLPVEINSFPLSQICHRPWIITES